MKSRRSLLLFLILISEVFIFDFFTVSSFAEITSIKSGSIIKLSAMNSKTESKKTPVRSKTSKSGNDNKKVNNTGKIIYSYHYDGGIAVSIDGNGWKIILSAGIPVKLVVNKVHSYKLPGDKWKKDSFIIKNKLISTIEAALKSQKDIELRKVQQQIQDTLNREKIRNSQNYKPPVYTAPAYKPPVYTPPVYTPPAY